MSQIAYHGTLTLTEDPASIVASLQAIKDEVNIIFFHGYETRGRKLFLRLHEAGLYGSNRLVLTPGWWDSDWYNEPDTTSIAYGKKAAVLEASDGAVMLSTDVQLNLGVYNAWKTDFLAYSNSTGGLDPIYHIYLAHDAVYSIAYALQSVITQGVASGVALWEDGDAILAALRAVDFTNGVSGPIKFEGNNRVGAFKINKMTSSSDFSSATSAVVGSWNPSAGLTMEASFSGLPGQILPPPPPCSTSDVVLNMQSECNSQSKHSITFSWGTMCSGGESLPGDTEVDCEYTPMDSTAGIITLIGEAQRVIFVHRHTTLILHFNRCSLDRRGLSLHLMAPLGRQESQGHRRQVHAGRIDLCIRLGGGRSKPIDPDVRRSKHAGDVRASSVSFHPLLRLDVRLTIHQDPPYLQDHQQ